MRRSHAESGNKRRVARFTKGMKAILPVGVRAAAVAVVAMLAGCGPRQGHEDVGAARTAEPMAPKSADAVARNAAGAEPTGAADAVAAGGEGRAVATLPVLRAAPSWVLKDVDGREVKAADFKGKVVLVDFWATWCAPCRKEMPEYEALRKKYAERGLVVLGLSLDDGVEPAELKRFGETMKVGYPLLLADPEVAEAFGDFKGLLPTAYLIDREGNIRHVKTGLADMRAYERLVVSLL